MEQNVRLNQFGNAQNSYISKRAEYKFFLPISFDLSRGWG